ncbi:MAG TPA: LemA family protein [Caulobacteraceae bacterium]
MAFAAAALSLTACGVNDIPTKQVAAQAKWADVQAAYQRRADLVPQLVATVQGEATQERLVLVGVTEARAKATSVTIDASKLSDPAAFQQFQQAQDGLSSSLGRLLAVSENYPTLQSSQAFLTLQSQLEGTENRINIARHDYNAAVQDYNTTLRVLPTSIWAATFYHDEKPMQLFTATDAAQAAPTVSFNFNNPPGAGAQPGATPPTPPATNGQ